MAIKGILAPAGAIAGLVGASAILLAGTAFAQTMIGNAALVQNDVRGHTGGEIFKITGGDTVFLDQLVQTAPNSRAKFVFLDTTNMSVGPESIVKLDQFVYKGNGIAETVSINATKGAFRFFSGSSDSRAYKVTTPQAVIGVRGTIYDVMIAGGQTFIKLQDGAITACVLSGAICRDLDQPGQTLVVNDNSIDGPFPPAPNSWDFGSLCNGGAEDLCNKTTRFAGISQPPPPPPGGGDFVPPPPPAGNFQPPPPPRVRAATLPGPQTLPVLPPGHVQPPVQVLPVPPGPRRPPGRPPVVSIDPPVYVPPVYVPPGRPPRIDPPGRPPRYPGRPSGKPPQESKPLPPPQVPGKYPEGRPRPGKPMTPPVIRDTRYQPGHWNGRPRVGIYTRDPGRYGSPDRWNRGPRWANVPRMQDGPRMMDRPPRMTREPRVMREPRMQRGPVMRGAPRMAGPQRGNLRQQGGGGPRVNFRGGGFGGGSFGGGLGGMLR